MDRPKIIFRAVSRGLSVAFIALILLTLVVMCLFAGIIDTIPDAELQIPEAEPQAWEINLLWGTVCLLAIGLGISEGFRSWKKYKKNSEDNSLS